GRRRDRPQAGRRRHPDADCRWQADLGIPAGRTRKLPRSEREPDQESDRISAGSHRAGCAQI
ncbi:hypothetical protein LTR94_035758, partial [Friedmanniomyces endolithicus]